MLMNVNFCKFSLILFSLTIRFDFESAPCSSSSLTQSKCPFAAAKINGVVPSYIGKYDYSDLVLVNYDGQWYSGYSLCL